jgi:hypothetical protein
MTDMTDTPSADAPLVYFVTGEPDLGKCARIFFENSGYRAEIADVTSLGTIMAAVRLAYNLQPDLIILSVCASALLKPLQGLRSDAATLTTPVILLCAAALDDPRIIPCRDLAEAYVQLPFEFDHLLQVASRLLGRMSPEEREDLAAWWRLRFSENPSPEAVAAYLGAGHGGTVGSEAEALLREMGPKALPALIRVLNENAWAWQSALRLIVGLAETWRSDEAIAAIAELLSHRDRARRWQALGCLGGQCVRLRGALAAVVDQGAPVMAEVMAALDGDDRELQTAAIHALGMLCIPEALVALRAFLPRADDQQRESVEMHLRWANT